MSKLCSCNAFPYYHIHDGRETTRILEADSQNEISTLEQLPGQTDIVNECEKIERNKLVGFCERCEHWTKFDRLNNEAERCEKCGGNFSGRIGYQITTQRTFRPDLKRKKLK